MKNSLSLYPYPNNPLSHYPTLLTAPLPPYPTHPPAPSPLRSNRQSCRWDGAERGQTETSRLAIEVLFLGQTGTWERSDATMVSFLAMALCSGVRPHLCKK